MLCPHAFQTSWFLAPENRRILLNASNRLRGTSCEIIDLDTEDLYLNQSIPAKYELSIRNEVASVGINLAYIFFFRNIKYSESERIKFCEIINLLTGGYSIDSNFFETSDSFKYNGFKSFLSDIDYNKEILFPRKNALKIAIKGLSNINYPTASFAEIISKTD